MYFFLHQKNASSGSSDLSRIICTCKLHEIDCIATYEHSPTDNPVIQNALGKLRGEREFYRLELVSDGQTVEIYPIESNGLYLFSDSDGLNVSDSDDETGAVATIHPRNPDVSVSASSTVSVQLNGNPLTERIILKDGDTLTFSKNLGQRLIFREPAWLAAMSAETRQLYAELLNSRGESGLTPNENTPFISTMPVKSDAAQISTNIAPPATSSLWFTLSLLILTGLISAASVYFILYSLSI